MVVIVKQKCNSTGFNNRIYPDLDLTAPVYWNAQKLDDSSPTQRFDVTNEMKDLIRELMNATAKPGFHGQGRDSHGIIFSTFEPVKVFRIEDHRQWMEYVVRRNAVRANVGGSPAEIRPAVATSGFRPPPGVQLDGECNEHLLFHGTIPAVVNAVCRGFDVRVARGGLFGGGCYFAENSSKSDEYVPQGAKQYMFLCRVVLGSPFVTPGVDIQQLTQLRRPPCREGHFDFDNAGQRIMPPCVHDRCDSLLAVTQATDPAARLHAFREFVVYDHTQCYPEYLIEYERR